MVIGHAHMFSPPPFSTYTPPLSSLSSLDCAHLGASACLCAWAEVTDLAFLAWPVFYGHLFTFYWFCFPSIFLLFSPVGASFILLLHLSTWNKVKIEIQVQQHSCLSRSSFNKRFHREEFYGLLTRFTEIILGFQLILLLCSAYSYRFLEVLLLLLF